MTSDPRPLPRIRDPELLRILHADPHKCCEITGDTYHIELHHVLPRSQGGDDARENLVMLRADLHAGVTRNNPSDLALLGEHVRSERPDTIAYLRRKLGERADDWMRRRLYIGEP